MVPINELLGVSPTIALVREQVQQLLARGQRAQRLPPILLQGETGTGKGLLARLIHRESSRRDGPFIDVSCAAIPDALLEAELFGFERGAFTDARQAKPGLLQAAHRGTLFLDEVALLSETLQAKLLKAIEDRAVRRLGSTRAENVDVQVIAASNEDLAAAARARRFRNDLYHRLAVVTLTLPTLRERPEDVLLLAEHFLSRASADYGLVPPRRFSPDARSALQQHRWPGNVRELSNVVESAVLLAEESTITAAMLGLSRRSRADGGWSRFDERVEDLEREQLLDALHDTNGNVSRAAIQLGISRNRLRYRIEKHHLDTDRHLLRSGQRQAPPTEAPRPASPVNPPAAAATAGLPWERRHLALLRVDLLPPATNGLPLDPARALAVIADKIRSFGGCVEEVAETTIVGAFGLEPIENAPSNAALAALAIRNAAERARRADSRVPAVKIAVHTGQLLVGRVAGRAQISFEDMRAAGDILAALGNAGQANSIVVSAAAAPFLERRFELARDRPLDGGAGLLYRLTRPEWTGFGLGGRALARFVGRQRELSVVGDQLAQAERQRGQIVAVIGEPGVGKSRFVYELTCADCVLGWRILSCSAFSYAVTTPSRPVVELLKGYFQIDDAETPSRIREKVSQKILEQNGRLEYHLSALLALLDVSSDDPLWHALEPQQRRQHTINAVKHLLLQESLTQPLLVIFEDLHWIDTESQGLLDSLVESLPAARVLLLVTYRPEYPHRWGGKTYYTQLHLDPLAGESAQALLQQLVGEDASLLPVKQLLMERTEGNPLFLEESVRALAETGTLQGSRGAYRLNASAASLEVPATIQAILAERIDRLSPEDTRLLQAAAVIGKDVPLAVLRAIADLPEEAVRRSLVHLQAAELVYETSLFPDLEYTFKHALTHDVAYNSLLFHRRKELHHVIGLAMEELYAERLAEHYEVLAHHFWKAEDWAKALEYLTKAAEKAAKAFANLEAAALYDQALTALSHLEESPAKIENAIDLRFGLRNALHPLGEFDRYLDCLHQAKDLAEASGDHRRLGWTLAYLTHVYTARGDYDPAIESGERALMEPVAELGIRVVGGLYLGAAYHCSGDYQRAIECFRRTLACLEGQPVHERFGLVALASALTRGYFAMSLAEIGRFVEGRAYGEQGVHIAEAANHPYSQIWVKNWLGYLLLRSGDGAIETLEHALVLCEDTGTRLGFPWAASFLGSAYALAKRLDEAVPLLERGVAAGVSMRHGMGQALRVSLLSEAYLAAGRTADALESAERALTLSREHKERGHEAWTLRLLGEIHGSSAAPKADLAEAFYSQAIDLAEKLGMCPLAGHCYAGLAHLYRQKGDSGQAEAHLTTATRIYREVGSKFWLGRAIALTR